MEALFDPRLHPRNRHGRFLGVLGKLPEGGRLRLPDGIVVHRVNRNRFRVEAPGNVPQNVPSAGQAAAIALDASARSQHRESLGGPVSHDGESAANRAGVVSVPWEGEVAARADSPVAAFVRQAVGSAPLPDPPASPAAWHPGSDTAWTRRSTPARSVESYRGPGRNGLIPEVVKARGSSVGTVYSASVFDPATGLSHGSRNVEGRGNAAWAAARAHAEALLDDPPSTVRRLPPAPASPPTGAVGLAVSAADLEAEGIDSALIPGVLTDLQRKVAASPHLNTPRVLRVQARAAAIARGGDGYRHKDDQASFWDRMEALGYDRPADQRKPALAEGLFGKKAPAVGSGVPRAVTAAFDRLKHPKDRRGRFMDTLNAMQPPTKEHIANLSIHDSTFQVARMKKGFLVTDHSPGGTSVPHADAQSVADHFEALWKKQDDDEFAKFREEMRAETAASRADTERMRGESNRLAEAEFDKRYPKNEDGLRYYHRLEGAGPNRPHATPDDANGVIRAMLTSGELWGKAKALVAGGGASCAQAHMGRLPPGAAGVEFVTEVPQDPSGAPHLLPQWSMHSKRKKTDGLTSDGEITKLKIKITDHRLA